MSFQLTICIISKFRVDCSSCNIKMITCLNTKSALDKVYNTHSQHETVNIVNICAAKQLRISPDLWQIFQKDIIKFFVLENSVDNFLENHIINNIAQGLPFIVSRLRNCEVVAFLAISARKRGIFCNHTLEFLCLLGNTITKYLWIKSSLLMLNLADSIIFWWFSCLLINDLQKLVSVIKLTLLVK